MNQLKNQLKGNAREIFLVCALLVIVAIACSMSSFRSWGRRFEKRVDYSQVYGQRIKDNPNDFGAIYLRGLHRCHQGQYQDAIDDMSLILDQGSDRVDALAVRCECLYKLKRYDEALKDINRVLELDSQDETYWLMRADVYEAMGRKDLADQDVASSKKLAGPPEWKKDQ